MTQAWRTPLTSSAGLSLTHLLHLPSYLLTSFGVDLLQKRDVQNPDDASRQERERKHESGTRRTGNSARPALPSLLPTMGFAARTGPRFIWHLRWVHQHHQQLLFSIYNRYLRSINVQCEDLYELISCLLPEVTASPAQHCTYSIFGNTSPFVGSKLCFCTFLFAFLPDPYKHSLYSDNVTTILWTPISCLHLFAHLEHLNLAGMLQQSCNSL